jgi:glycosyltransferase involved in cell wall biosynthesis
LTGDSLRVAVVTSRLDIGGTERHLARVLPELKRRGLDVALYVMERGGPLEDEIARQGVRIEGPHRLRVLHWIAATLALTRWLRRERPALIHFFLPRPYVFGSLAAELAGHRRRIMSRRSLTDYRKKYPLLGLVERLLHRRTLGMLGNSQAVLDQLATEVGDRRKLALIHNGLDLSPLPAASDRHNVRRGLRIPDEALAIVVVANLIAYKGYHDLVAALTLIKDELPAPWRLLVVGRDDGIGTELKQQAEALQIADSIMWLGERSDVEQLLAASDIFVLPSHQEGFSNALLEAMAAQLPVIATAVGGNTDAVVDQETGLLVPAMSPPSLSAAILRLAKDANLRRRFAEAGRRRVEQQFSLKACVDRYERLYRVMVEANPPPLGEILADKATYVLLDVSVPESVG